MTSALRTLEAGRWNLMAWSWHLLWGLAAVFSLTLGKLTAAAQVVFDHWVSLKKLSGFMISWSNMTSWYFIIFAYTWCAVFFSSACDNKKTHEQLSSWKVTTWSWPKICHHLEEACAGRFIQSLRSLQSLRNPWSHLAGRSCLTTPSQRHPLNKPLARFCKASWSGVAGTS